MFEQTTRSLLGVTVPQLWFWIGLVLVVAAILVKLIKFWAAAEPWKGSSWALIIGIIALIVSGVGHCGGKEKKVSTCGSVSAPQAPITKFVAAKAGWGVSYFNDADCPLRCRVKATGVAKGEGYSRGYGPDGQSGTVAGMKYQSVNSPLGAFVGYIPGAPSFFIGSDRVVTIPPRTEIRFAVNLVGRVSGGFEVTIDDCKFLD